MKEAPYLRIGLPYGKHIRQEVYATLKASGIDVPEYLTVEKHRQYSFDFSLPSGQKIKFFVDNPRDLIYRLAENLCDAIITGSDFIRDWNIFQQAQRHLPKQWQRLDIQTMLILKNITASMGRLSFLTDENCPVKTLDEFFTRINHPICFTEFPYLASRKIQACHSYQQKYQSLLPQLLATFFSTHGAYGIQFPIIYSHGLTESKAISNPNVIIYDIICSGETSRLNKLNSIAQDLQLVYVGLFASNNHVQNGTTEALHEFKSLLEKITES